MMENLERQIGYRILTARKQANLSLDELAKKSMVAKATISKIERNLISPSVNTLIKISRGLKKHLNYFLSENEVDEVTYVKEEKSRTYWVQDKRVKIQSLTRRSDVLQIRSQLVTIEEGGHNIDEYIPHEGEEYIYCLKGQVEFIIEEKLYQLVPGDSLHYLSHLKHEWRNAGARQAELLWIHIT